jgi:hypothetical protein
MSNTKTPTIAPFPAWATDQEDAPTRYASIPTPETMKKTVLFGLPMRSFLTNEEVPDEAIQSFINQAISEIEHTLGLFITPVEFTERHDYSRHQNFWSFGHFKVNNTPVLHVTKYVLTFNNGIQGIPPLVNIPLEYIHVQPQEGSIQLVPAQGVSISGLLVSIYSGLGFHAFNSQMLDHWPGAVEVTYLSGFEKDKVPALLVGLIENLAAYKMLSVMGPILFPHNSVSIGIDGTSQSVGTLGPAFLQGRLADLEKMIQQQMEAAKGYYEKRFLIDVL